MTTHKTVPSSRPSNISLYDRDFYAWANEQAALLRAGRFQDADVENIAEEIESMGKREKRELISRLAVVLVHLLKWKYQSSFRSRSWQLTIKEQRRKIERHLDENPSLRPVLGEILAIAYSDAMPEAELQTGLIESTFPAECPWTIEQIFSAEWFPE